MSDGSAVPGMGGFGRTETNGSGATLVNGVFYGALAYLVGYLWVYVNLLDRDIRREIAVAFYGKSAADLTEEELEAVSLFLPGTGEYAGWAYHHALGGSVGLSVNLFPGTYAIDDSLIYPYTSEKIVELRETVLTEPWALMNPSSAGAYVRVVESPEGFAALSFVFVTPTALFFAGFFLARRHGEGGPLDGALAGSRVTAGFLLASMASAYLFTVSMSGITVGGSLGIHSEMTLDAVALQGSLGSGADFGADVTPVISIGPSLTRGILVGVVYPLAFATLGGAVAGLASFAGALNRLSEFI